MGRWYGNHLLSKLKNVDVDTFVGVPLHAHKEAIRGYNQADKIAKGLSASLGIDFEEKIVKRLKNTETQTNKSRYQRFSNMAGVFEVNKLEFVKDKKIGIVDDVLTTGSTIASLAEELYAAGALEVSVYSLAAGI